MKPLARPFNVLRAQELILRNVAYTSLSGCWLWQRYTVKAPGKLGYGHIAFDGERSISGFNWPAHRLSFYAFRGDVVGWMVLHICDVPACVNPWHLFLGTGQDNMRDRDLKGRNTRHEKHHKAKLTWDDVLEMRRLRAKGVHLQALAHQFGLKSESTVSDICLGHTWVDRTRSAA